MFDMLTQKLLTGFGGGGRGLEIKTLFFYFYNCHETQMTENNLSILAAFYAKEIWIKDRTLPPKRFSGALLLLTACVEFIWLISVDCQRLIWFDLIWPSSDFASLGHIGEICHTAGRVKFLEKHYVYVFAFHWAFDFMASSAIFFDLSPFSMHSFIIRNPMTYFRTRQWWDQIFFIKTDDGWQVVF